MLPHINGKWTGELIYGESFGTLAHEVLFFTVEIAQQDDEFTGTYMDVDGIGINPYTAGIMGFCDQNSINFTREYTPSLPGLADKSPVTDASFSGSYNAATGEFEGEWVGVAIYTYYNTPCDSESRGGTWRMRRQA